MYRERRNREKLEQYYRRFMEGGSLDSNVHPWVAASWLRCQTAQVPHEVPAQGCRLGQEELEAAQAKNQPLLAYLDGLIAEFRQPLAEACLGLLLLNREGYVLRDYAPVEGTRLVDDVTGLRLLEPDIGTTAISLCLEHDEPVLLFGPELWCRALHRGDALAVPIRWRGRLAYVLSIYVLWQPEEPYELWQGLLLSLKYSLEGFLSFVEQQKLSQVLLEQLPMSFYQVEEGGLVRLANSRGRQRLPEGSSLPQAFLNYDKLPIAQALAGQPVYRQEATWIAPDRTYEDITTAVPLTMLGQVDSALVITMSIDDLKTTIAHAPGYNSRYSLYSMVGESKEFLLLQSKAGRLARSSGNVLIQGEPGTGKQRLAHGIHQASPRSAGPLITVQCCRQPQEELEEELFGRSAGKEPLLGKLELAQGGTLFLDEVEKLPKELCQRLAAALRGELPDEAGQPRRYDVRILAACDSNLRRLAAKGLFSSELYGLLATAVLQVPPLRERPGDIPVIAQHMLVEMGAQYNTGQKQLTPAAVAALTKCRWPGNVKQLQGVIEKACFHSHSGLIDVGDLVLPEDRNLERSWKHEKEAFVEAWKGSGGNISKLAESLMVSRVTLYRYMRKYGLSEQGLRQSPKPEGRGK